MEDLHNIWPHRWVTPNAVVKKSKIHGEGTFATEPIKKGEVVVVYGGIIVPKSDLENYRKKIDGIYGIQISEDFFICPTERGGGCFNHSCESNLGYKFTILIVATRDIKAGEELVHEYAFTETNFKPFKCTCGSPKCRKIIKPTDWENKELREKYGEYFSSFLQSKF